jgi:hypothetical protein
MRDLFKPSVGAAAADDGDDDAAAAAVRWWWWGAVTGRPAGSRPIPSRGWTGPCAFWSPVVVAADCSIF